MTLTVRGLLDGVPAEATRDGDGVLTGDAALLALVRDAASEGRPVTFGGLAMAAALGPDQAFMATAASLLDRGTVQVEGGAAPDDEPGARY